MAILTHARANEPDNLEPVVREVLIDQGYPNNTEVTIHLVDNDVMAQRNASAFGKSGPTDVLSFPIEEFIAGRPPTASADGPPITLGDVFIAPAVVALRCEERGTEFASEMALLVVHGVLHLMGHDHLDDDEADVMESIEARVLIRHGFDRR